MMHTIRYGAAGTYPRTPCGLKLGEDRFHYCGPRFLTQHCQRESIEPCPTCWPEVTTIPRPPQTEPVPMRTPIAYFGGKSRLAPWIVSLFPPHRVYVEPFAGSAAVLFAKVPSTHEIINDRDNNLVTFLRVLRDRPEDLERVCRATPYSRAEYSDCLDIAGAPDELERARRWWVRSSQSFSKAAGANVGWSVSIKRGSNNARSVWNRLERFAAASARLGSVTVENADALDVIARYDDPHGVIYCDPPYLGEVRTSQRDGRRPAGDYAHEFDSPDQHRTLAEALSSARATVFVSGYPSPLYDEIYAGWHTARRSVMRPLANGRSSQGTRAEEVIWSNRPIVDRLDLWGEPA